MDYSPCGRYLEDPQEYLERYQLAVDSSGLWQLRAQEIADFPRLINEREKPRR